MTTVIEFGSRRHGCNDFLSDKDVYLLCGPNDDISQEKGKLERQGYSVTVSSKERAEYLSAKGSLFIHHVFFEGLVTEGSDEDRIKIQNIWCSAPCYDQEIEENIEMLGVLEAIPSTIEALATVNDIVICSLRNILIRKLANNGLFVFSWRDVLAQSKRHNFINDVDEKIMRQARIYKNRYRLGFTPKLEWSFFEHLERITKKIMDKNRKFKFGSHKDVLASPEKAIEGSYSQLRAIELLCSHYHFHKSMRKYSVLVKDPAYFSTFGPNKALQRTSR